MSYEEVRCQIAELYGWTFDDIDDMSFEQISSALCGGKRSDRIPVQSIEEAREVQRNWRKYAGV